MIKNLESIKEKIDIIDIVSHFIPLKKVGSNYNACCPFHSEKSPSFVVSPSKQIFHCFGCAKGGDVFTFIQELKGVNFSESVEIIAQLANLSLEFESNTKVKQNKDFYTQATALNEVLQEMYLQTLLKNEKICMYLQKRGLEKDDFAKYEIGLSPSGKEIAINLNPSQEKLAFDLGILSRSKAGEIYAPLAHRITFTLRNTNYKIAGFSGRSHPYYNFRNAGKYINSRESNIFKKSNILYRLSHIKNIITNTKCVYAVEGFMDAIALDKMGIHNAVATAGTAFSVAHLSALNKFVDCKIIFAFDKDEAGGQATIRALELCFKNQIYNVSVSWNLNNVKDFGEVLQKGESLKLQEMQGFEFYLKYHAKRANTNQEKERLLNKAREIINTCNLYYEKQSLLKTTAKILHIPQSAIFNQNHTQKPTTATALQMQGIESLILQNALSNDEFAYILKESISADDANAFKHLNNAYLSFLAGESSAELNALEISEFKPCNGNVAFSELIRALMIEYKQNELQNAKQAKNISLICHLRKELDNLLIPF